MFSIIFNKFWLILTNKLAAEIKILNLMGLNPPSLRHIAYEDPEINNFANSVLNHDPDLCRVLAKVTTMHFFRIQNQTLSLAHFSTTTTKKNNWTLSCCREH
jgi:hypothetical protein